MSFCTKCGREILDESLGCPYCSVHDNTQPGETNETQTQEDMAQSETTQNETNHIENNANHEENTMQSVQSVQNQETQQNTAQSEEPAEKVDSFTVEDSKGTYQRFENTAQSNQNAQNNGTWQQNNNTSGTWQQNNSQTQYRPVAEQTIHPALKAVIIVLIVLAGGLGAVAGLIAGLILMKSPVEDYRSFGKLMTIVSAVMLALSLVCCVVMLAFNVMIPGLYYYH